jgi:hypothetical protein
MVASAPYGELYGYVFLNCWLTAAGRKEKFIFAVHEEINPES